MNEAEVDNEIYIQGLLMYINDTPELMSLLYDTGLLPEQTMGTLNYKRTLLITDAWKNRRLATQEDKTP